MDGVQRNFSMMAEKIDRMRCLRERCDNYVRLIKLTLDETIQEQNSLLDGSAIHNRLKYLGLIDKPYKSSSNKFNNNKLYSKNIDSDYKYKYLVFNDHPEVRQLRKKTSFNTNDMDLSNNYGGYNSSYKLGARDYSSTTYDDYNNPYYMPISSQKYGKTMNIRTPDPQEYQEVYYFPTSKPIPQYPRHTTERFYRRKPVKQYPVEEVPYWPIRYPKPVRVIERQPPYPILDYDYHRTNDFSVSSTNIEPYTHRHRTRFFPTNDMYHSFDDSNYYYENDLRQRPFSSITRPCSPVYSRDPLYDRIHLENSGSLLEKKIRDYVWNPNKDHIEKYTTPSYEKSNYYTDFKPSLNKHRENETFRTRTSFSFDSHEPSRKNDVVKENAYRRNSIMTPQERKPSIDNSFQSLRNDDHFSESTPNKKKPETPLHIPKRISFDLDSENIEIPDLTTSIGEINNENAIIKERKSMFGRRESITKINDKRRTSLLSNDDYPIIKQRVIPNDKNGNSRRESFSKQEKLPLIENSFESDKYLNLKNKPLGSGLNSLEKNVHAYNNDFNGVDYYHSNNSQLFPNTKTDKINDIAKDITPDDNARHKLRRDSNDSEKSKLIKTTEKPNFNYQDQVESISNKRDKVNIIERRDSYKDEQKFKINENISGNKIKSNNIDNQIENEYNNYSNRLNDTPKNISPLKVNNDSDINNVNKYNINQQESDNLQQYVSNNNEVENENNFEKTVPYPIVNDSNKEADIMHSNGQDSSDFNTIKKEPELSQDILIDEFKNSTEYYHDHYNDDIKEPLTHEYESQPENDSDHVANDNNYYPDELADTDKIMPHNIIEPVQQNEIIDENNVHDEYYYKNSTDDIKESPAEIEFENPPQSQENEIDKQHPNDDYYYQNYPNTDPKEPPENQYSELGNHGEYASEQNEHDDYYYQNHARDNVKEQQGDQQYVEPNYQGNYSDQQATHDDYYYQNYDEKGQPENQYTESSNQGEYATESNDHDDYYDQKHPKDNTNENQPEQHYAEPEQPVENYVDGEQSNYYYENNSNIPLNDQYDEHDQQKNYIENPHMNDDYYYEKHDDNYNESSPKEQYDGYVGDQQEANNSYYPDSQANNYDPQQNYETDSYQTQPYDQNPNNENYDYSDNMDESKSINQNSTVQS